MERVSENICVETNFLGCNPSFIVTTKGIVMIDTPQKPDEAFAWKKKIQQYGDIAYIINTDHHQDHALGNYYFSGDIIIHEGTMKNLLAEDRIKLCKNWIKLLEPQSPFLMENYFLKKPAFVYKERMTVNLGGEMFQLIHLTSHTKDETIVYMPERKIIFSGDTVCTNGIPSLHESYPIQWLEALKFIETLDFNILVPGHGEIGDKDSVRQFYNELSTLINRVEEKINKGTGKDVITNQIGYEDSVHAKYPPEFSELFDGIIKLSIGRLYDELVRNGPRNF